MIEQLPIINLILLLTTALVIPLFKKQRFMVTLILSFVVLFIVWLSALYLLYHVNTTGAFYYRFGGYSPTIGLELLINPFSALFTFFVITLLMIIFIYSTADASDGIHEREYGRYYILMFILLFAMFGIIYTNDLFNTYVFMEILSITTCAIISIKRKKKNYAAAFRYVMLNEMGSLSYLFGVALLYMVTGYTNIELVFQGVQDVWVIYPTNIIIAAIFMIVGLGLKAAIFPLHIWLPDAHSAAPSSSSAILSAIVVKVYLIILVKVLFSVFGITIIEALHIPSLLMVIGAVGIVMGSFFAIAQHDIKRMLGYSSVAQIGYIVLGIGLASSLGLRIAFYHVFSHGIMKSVLFLSVGAVIYQRNVRKVTAYNGIGYMMPLSIGMFTLAALGMIGIPLTSGFISKFNLGIAALDGGQGIYIIILVVSGILNAIYYLPIIIAAFLRENPENQIYVSKDKVPLLMIMPILILGAFIVIIGVYPAIIFDLVDSAVSTFSF